MKHSCSFILKASMALVLALVMLFGTVSTSIAAVIENAPAAAEAEDVAGTGADVDVADEAADVDLADTGYSTLTVYYKIGSGSYTSTSISASASATFDVTLAASQSFKCIIETDNSEWWGNASLSSNFSNLAQINGYTGNYSSDANVCTYTSSSAGTYTVTVQFNNDGKKIKIEGGSGGSGGSADSGQTTGTAVDDDDLIAVLKRTKLYIYYGDYWNDNAKRLYQVTGETNIANGGPLTNKLGDNSDIRVYYACVETDTDYRITHETSYPSWAASFSISSIDGTDGAGSVHFNTDGNGHGSTAGNAAISWDTDKDSDSIKAGTASCNLKATATGSTAYASATAVKYFYTTNNTNFYEFNPNDTDELEPGEYTIYATAYDGNVYVAASSTATLTVEATHAVTTNVYPAGAGTISLVSGTAVGVSTATTITATPAAGYAFSSWTFGNGIAGGSTTANPTTITTSGSGSNYTVQANFTKVDLTVSKTESHGTFTVSPTTAQIDNTITVSGITPAKGYELASSNPVTYTYNSTTQNASESETPGEYTFTMPGYNTNVTVSFIAKTGNGVTRTVTPAGGGNLYVGSTTATTSEATTYTTGDTLYARAVPADAYTFSTFRITYANETVVEVPAASATQSGTAYYYQLDTDGSEFSASNVGDITVEAVFTAKPTHTITVKTSNSAYGTASASVVNAYEGQSVTLTAAENTGTFQKWKVTSGTVTGVDNDTNKTKTFTMGSTDLVITANFVAYSGTSNFYYNSYGDNGQPASSRYGARMTQAKLNGEEYSYYHVTGRTEDNQLFTVSYESPVYSNYNTYFQIPKSWGGTPKVLFYATDGNNLGDWVDMQGDGSDSTKNKYKYPIPDGARSVRFKHGTNETDQLFFTSGNNGWWTEDNLSSLNAFNSSNPVETNFWENFNSTKYTNNWSSGGFSGHNANRGESHAYTKPVTGNGIDFPSNKSDYYILVLYKDKTYTINGVEHKAGTDPEIIWLPTLPVETTGVDYATIYAKDGCINEARGTSHVIGTTEVSGDDVTNVARKTVTGKDNNNASTTIECYTQASAEKGKSITVTTEIDSTYTSKYVVKGWDVNGTTYGLDSTPTGNTYSVTFTVPDVNKVEITPIYWLRSTYDTTIFFVNNFDKVPSGWGDALYYYYWGGSQVNVNTEERYPGQPFVHEGGQYYAQVPSDVVGVTLNNAVWDTIHGQFIMGKGGSESANHYQTYDYDNFAKIKNERTGLNAIHFTFKYESKKDNFNSSSGGSSITISDFNDTNGNGWEDFKDPLGRDNNIFGGTDVSGTGTLYVVSNGYARNYQGNYATEWSIYYAAGDSPTTATLVGTIPSSALILDASADFSNYSNGDYGPYLSTYQPVWTTLKNTYATTPVKITYEQGIYGDKSRINRGGATPSDSSDYATRIDGKWDYTLDTDYSTAEIKIQYSDDNGLTYSDDTFASAGSNVGPTTEAQAFFTNDDNDPSYENTHLVTPDHHVRVSTTNKYTFKTVPKASTGYKFVGWYRLDASADNPVLIGSDAESASFMSSKATFIARYKKVTEGFLVIAHDVDGSGSSTMHTVKAEIYNGEELVNTLEGDSVELDSDYITSASTYKIKVTLTSIAAANSYIENSVDNSVVVPTIDCSAADDPFYKNPAYTRTVRYAGSIYPVNIVTTVDTFDVRDLYDETETTKQNITVLSYTTTFNKLPTYTINYKYHGRESSGDSDYLTFVRTITLSPDEAEGKDAKGASYAGNGGTALRPTYTTTQGDGLVNDITANAPNQNDLKTQVFNKDITWQASAYDADNATNTAVTIYATETDPTYTLTYTYYDDDGTEHSAQTVTGSYNTLIRFGETANTYVTAATKDGESFSYWACGEGENEKPLTNSILYSMRLIDNVTIHPVYGGTAEGWDSAIDKITRTHETSDTSDNVFTDFALRFTGFDDGGAFIHINPDHLNDYKVGVAVVYDTAGDNTTLTTEQINDSAFYNLSAYTDAKSMIQLLVDKNISSAKLGKISTTTCVTKFDVNSNSNLTNLNRIDLAVKYNYSQNYKRCYDAYAYIIDNSTKKVIAVSPVKSGYLYDGTLPVGN